MASVFSCLTLIILQGKLPYYDGSRQTHDQCAKLSEYKQNPEHHPSHKID